VRHYTVKTEQWYSKMLVKSKFKQMRFESSAEQRMRVNETKFSFHTDGSPQQEEQEKEQEQDMGSVPDPKTDPKTVLR